MSEQNRVSIYDMEFVDIQRTLDSWGQPGYRAAQLWQGLYQNLWDSPDQFSNFPASLRRKIDDKFNFSRLTPTFTMDSTDGETRKILFKLPDNNAIEAVLMSYNRRKTLCISTQVGCAMGCVFCATGQMGFVRNLSSGEIIEQVLFFAKLLGQLGEKVTNIVIMGMGEPLHNYDATLQAIDRLEDSKGFNFGARRFTISSVGLVPAIRRFSKEKRQENLAISLHAAEDKLRSSLIPINRRYPIKELMDACVEYIELTNRRLTFEWALIRGVNDSVEHAENLGDLMQLFRRPGSTLCHVNVIPLNPTQKYDGAATPTQQALIFKQILEKKHIPCTVRIRRGIDIQAGCGQLAIKVDTQSQS